MNGNGRAFVSHAFQDIERCRPLLAALAAWGVDTWFQAGRDEADETLSPRVEQAIAERDIFLRVCSLDADRSHWVRLETETFRRLQAEDRAERGTTERILIYWCADPLVGRPSLEDGDGFVDAAGVSLLRWRPALRRALGLHYPDQPAPSTADTSDTDADEDEGNGSGEDASDVRTTRETAALPRVSRREVMENLRALAEQLRLGGPEDSVVSVAIGERAGAEAEAGTARAAILEVIEGEDAGRTYSLCKARITLGRKLDRDIFLMDLAASRRHAAIERDEQGQFVIHDDHSTNGTYVNERPVTEQTLADGDLIRVGKTTFRLRLPRRDD